MITTPWMVNVMESKAQENKKKDLPKEFVCRGGESGLPEYFRSSLSKADL